MENEIEKYPTFEEVIEEYVNAGVNWEKIYLMELPSMLWNTKKKMFVVNNQDAYGIVDNNGQRELTTEYNIRINTVTYSPLPKEIVGQINDRFGIGVNNMEHDYKNRFRFQFIPEKVGQKKTI